MPATLDITTNFAVSALAGGAGGLGTALNPADTSLILGTGDGAKFPVPTATRTFRVMLGTITGTHEIVQCTTRVTDTLTTIVRAQEGTSAQTWPVGTPVEAPLTSGNLNSISSAIINGLAGTYNVRDYLAVGDGTTDDTTACQNALNACNTAGGGTVYFPGGTYLVQTLTFYSYTRIRGDGINASTIKLKNSVNGDLLQGVNAGILINLSAANGTSSGTSGANNWSLEDITLDGNKANQSSGWCLRGYGYGHILSNVRIKNGKSGCVQWDWNGGNGALDDQMEAHWSNVKIHTSEGPGVQWGGPHDSQWTNVIVYDNNDLTLVSTNKLTPGIHIAPNAAGMLLTNVHVWNTNLAFMVEAGVCKFVNCMAEGTGRGSNPSTCVLVLAGQFDWTGGEVFGSSGNEAVSTGFQLGQTAGGTPLSPYMIQQSASLTTAAGVTSSRIITHIEETRVACINYANEAGRNLIAITTHLTAGVYFIGSANANSDLWVLQKGLTTAGNFTLNGDVSAANVTATSGMTISGGNGITLSGAGGGAKFTGSGRSDPANDTTVRITRSSTGGTLDSVGDTNGWRWIGNSGSVYTAAKTLDNTGNMALGGRLAVAQSATAVVITNASTITTASTGVSRVNPGGAVTGIILQSGTVAGQICMVVNEATAANTVTFNATPATSHVASGAEVIAGVTAATFIWDSATSLWYRSK